MNTLVRNAGLLLSILLPALSTAAPLHAATVAQYQVADRERDQICRDAMSPFGGSIAVKRLSVTGFKSQPAMLTDTGHASDDEANLLLLLIQAQNKCDDAQQSVYRDFFPRVANLHGDYLKQRIDVYKQVADKKLTYGQANHLLNDMHTVYSAKQNAIYPPKTGAAVAPSEADAASLMQPGAASQ